MHRIAEYLRHDAVAVECVDVGTLSGGDDEQICHDLLRTHRPNVLFGVHAYRAGRYLRFADVSQRVYCDSLANLQCRHRL